MADRLWSVPITLSDHKNGFRGQCISQKQFVLGTKLLWDTNRKPHLTYRMVSRLMTLTDS